MQAIKSNETLRLRPLNLRTGMPREEEKKVVSKKRRASQITQAPEKIYYSNDEYEAAILEEQNLLK